MTEVWENPFASALLKIERAVKHIADIEQRLRTSSNRYGASLHMDAKTGEQFLYYRLIDDSLGSDLATMIGDAIHNLRSALDIAWSAVIPPHAVSKYTHFPIDPNGTREKLESTMTKNHKVPLSSPVIGFMLDGVQPYKGGDADLLALHLLDIDDKHRLLAGMSVAFGIKGLELENEEGTVNGFDIEITSPEVFRQTVPMGAKLKNDGEPTFSVTFRKGTPLDRLPVIPTLRRFSVKVEEIVLRLRTMN
jgi:hypothetical protein